MSRRLNPIPFVALVAGDAVQDPGTGKRISRECGEIYYGDNREEIAFEKSTKYAIIK